MENEIKNDVNCVKQAYVPARVKTIEISSRKVICISGTQTEQLEEVSTVDGYD